MFDLGIQELIVVFVVALIVFGPKRLPELGRTIGKGMLELKKAMEGVREQIHAESEMIQEGTGNTETGGKKEPADLERSGETESGEATADAKDTTDEKEEHQANSANESFYRSEDDAPREGKEDTVDGR